MHSVVLHFEFSSEKFEIVETICASSSRNKIPKTSAVIYKYIK